MADDQFDFIVVGAGAGGGPLACNLARAGYTVALLEAGSDPADKNPSSSYFNYSVPAFHGQATQDPSMRWDFYVQHYANKDRQTNQYDSKYVPDKGVLYPRAAALGGCAAHNAMITVYPHNEDWEAIRQLTGDPTWSAENMRHYFQKLEDCRYAPPAPNDGRHGFGGWLATSLADPNLILQKPDAELFTIVVKAAVNALLADVVRQLAPAPTLTNLERVLAFLGRHVEFGRSLVPRVGPDFQKVIDRVERAFVQVRADLNVARQLSQQVPKVRDLVDQLLSRTVQASLLLLQHNDDLVQLLVQLQRYADPNDWRVAEQRLAGVYATPLATNGIRRNSPREFILNTKKEYPDRLTILTGCLATKILFSKEGDVTSASGVQYWQEAKLYRASREPHEGELPPSQVIRARREVILAGGAFNTPQLLLLSGIGPSADLDSLEKANPDAPKIKRVCDLPGVGKNLQDRYEVAVVTDLDHDFQLLEKADDFQSPQGPAFEQWQQGKGLYTTNGVVLSIIKHSQKAAPDAPPDLYIFGIPGFFKGYYPGYADKLVERHNIFTWAILKAHTRNTEGEVKLKTCDPRDTPAINFHYFDEGSDGWQDDLDAVVEGVEFVRGVMQRTGMVKAIELPPGTAVTPDQVRDFIRKEAWGHHACGTCKMGRKTDNGRPPEDDLNAVVDSDFRVYGVRNLRVVDASVFPRIPGFFIVTAVYMISEKASDAIVSDARRPG